MGLAPWVTIWTQPRTTVRWLIQQDLRTSVILLGALQGVEFLFYCAYFASLGRELPTALIVTSVAIVGPVLGITALYIWAGLLALWGKLLGGKAQAGECRVVLAWSRIPMTLSLGMWLLLLMGASPHPFLFSARAPSSLFIAAICAIATLWSLALLVGAVREVQGFSTMRSILSISAATFVLLILFASLNIIRN